MAIEAKEVAVYIRKFLFFSIKISYRTVRRHPLISAVVFLLLMLYRIFPSLFTFLVTSSPVIICTALLLGTLLSYGTPNIPKFEEANKTAQDISSGQVRSVVGNLVTKKDEKHLTVETHAEASTEVGEIRVEEEAGNETVSNMPFFTVETHAEASTEVGKRRVQEEAGNETVSDVPFATIHDMGIRIDGDTNERNDEKRLIEGEVSGPSQDVGDSGLAVHIAKPKSDNLFESSLGSPWQPIDSHDASSDSDSDSSGSSSPDASMSDIIPMLDELHPLLDCEHPQATVRSNGYSDSSSSGSSSAEEEEIKNKEDRGKESAQEEHNGNEDAVAWNADDQKNVMDLGVSELERNRRLESLIEKRRVRKLIRCETEKNLIDLDSYYPTPIPSISAPRRNPFDLSYDSVPGSAPSALHWKENPFNLPYDQVERISSFSREYLSHHDFIPSHEKDVFSGMHESSTLGPSYSDDVHEDKDISNLKSYLRETEFTSLQRQSSEDSDSKSSSESESNKVSSVMGQDSNFLHAANVDAEHVVVGGNPSTIVVEESHEHTDSFRAPEEETGEAAAIDLPLSDFVKSEITEAKYEESDTSSSEENEKGSEIRIRGESSNLLQLNTAIDMPVVNPVYDSSPSSVGKTISNTSSLDESSLLEGKDNFTSSSLPSDAQEDLSAENINYVEVKETAGEELSLSKASSNASSLDETKSGSMEITEIKERDDILSETSKPAEDVPEPADEGIMIISGSQEIHTVDVDKSTRSEGEDNFTSCSLPSDAQEDLSAENGNYVVVKETAGEELSISKASSCASSLDETKSGSMEITEIKERDDILSETSKATEDVPEPADEGIMLISGSQEIHTVDVDKSTRSEGDYITDVPLSREEFTIHSSSKAGLKESHVSISDLTLIHEEHADDFKFGEHESTIEPNLRVIEEPDLNPKATEDISNDNDSDALVASFTIPTQTGSTEFSALSKTKSDSSHSEGNITDGEMYAGSTEIKDIDESLLSELDAVSDFRVNQEIKLDHGDFDTLDVARAEMNDIVSLSSHSEDNLRIAKEVNPVMDRPALLETEVEPSVVPSHEDPELTVYNSKLHVLEACSPEELDSVFKQRNEKNIDEDTEMKETVPQLQVVGGNSVEDINLDPKQSSARTNYGPTENDSDVAYIEAKSVEDLDLAFKQISESTVKNPNPPKFTQGETSHSQLEGEVSEGTASISRKKNRKKSGADSSSSSSDSE